MIVDQRDVTEHFDRLAVEYDAWKEKSSYYYDLLADIYRGIIPEGSSVLEIGCGTGTLLARIRPSRGIGVDISPKMIAIAAAKYPEFRFLVADASDLRLSETFDYVMIPDVIEHLPDVPGTFVSVRRVSHGGTKVIVTCVNPLWAPVLHLAEKLGLKMPEGEHRWLHNSEIIRIAETRGFSLVSHQGRILMPKKVPLLSNLVNRMATAVGWLKPICMTDVYVFLVDYNAGRPYVHTQPCVSAPPV